jgi:hypothetical protein
MKILKNIKKILKNIYLQRIEQTRFPFPANKYHLPGRRDIERPRRKWETKLY